MGRETKVGLLVGMSFIVCVAIVLSHRGDLRSAPDPASFEIATVLTDAPVPPVRAASEPGRADANRSRSTETRPRGGRPSAPDGRVPAELRRQQPGATRSDAQVAEGGNPAVNGGARGGDGSSLARFARRGEPLPGPGGSGAGDTQALVSTPEPIFASAGPAGEPLRLTVPNLDETGLAPNAAADISRSAPSVAVSTVGQATSASPARPASAGAIPGETYVVKPGDTLGQIAVAHYGTSRGGVLEAIYEANRDQMSSPDRMVAGRTLVLPRLDRLIADMAAATAVDPRIAALSSDAGRSTSEPPAGQPAAAPAATYEVKPGDTLTRIARQQYGSTAKSVLTAIYAANRDTMSSPDVVVAGRTLRLPELPGAVKLGPGSGAPAVAAVLPRSVDAPRPEPARAAGARSLGREGVDWVWYQLKKGDVYSTVAARKLGSAKRWKELAEINADIFPDPSLIRWGVNIRVPVERAGLTATRSDSRGDT